MTKDGLHSLRDRRFENDDAQQESLNKSLPGMKTSGLTFPFITLSSSYDRL